MKSMKKILLLAKVEVTPGTDPLPVAATNAILVRNVTASLVDAEFVQRGLIRPYKGNSGSLAVGVHRKLSFEIELAGSGAAGTAPAWGPLLRACGFLETTTPTTDVTYHITSDDPVTLTLHTWVDGILMKMTNAIGTVSFQMDAKTIPVMKFDFLGIYSAATDGTQPAANTVNYSAFLQPQTVGKINTPTFTFFSVAACMAAFSVDVANALVWRELVNCAGPRSADRQPKGTALLELASMSGSNWGEIIRQSTVGAAHIVHGTVPGNIVDIALPHVQVNSVSLSDQDNIAMVNLGFDINPDVGDDEIVVVVK